MPRITWSTRLSALAVATALTVSACGSDEPAPAPADSSAPTAAATTEAPAAEQSTIEVDETIDDEVLGDTITLTGLVRDFDAPSMTSIPDDGGEWVLVEIDATAGDKYSGGIKGGWKLKAGDELAGSTTSIIDDDMDAAGFTPWEDLDSGESGTGWVAFQVNSRSDAYTFEYKRLAASVIGGGDPIPEKIWDVELPTS